MENEYTNGLFPEIIAFVIDNHTWYELMAVYFALAIPYYLTSKENTFIDFFGSIYESREDGSTGMQLGVPIFIFLFLCFSLLIAFVVSGIYCYIFFEIQQALPNYTANFSLKKMIIECAICFLFSFLVMTIGAVTKKEKVDKFNK
jgi:hypothetical protein